MADRPLIQPGPDSIRHRLQARMIRMESGAPCGAGPDRGGGPLRPVHQRLALAGPAVQPAAPGAAQPPAGLDDF